MFTITEAAKTELQNRLKQPDSKKLIRLQMRFSCLMKLKLTLDDSVQPNDEELIIDGFHFIIDKDYLHYFNGKKIDFIADQTGFMEFEAI